MRKMVRILTLMLICCLLLPAARAEDVCVVQDAAAASRVTTDRPYLRVRCDLPGEMEVTLTVHDQWGSLIYQRYYGLCSGSFESRDVHLPLEGEGCDYTVTLQAGEAEHTFTVTREMPLLTDTSVFAGGMSLRELNGGSSRKYAVVLDLCALNQGTATAPMLAEGKKIGEVYFSVLDGVLTVSASLFAEGEIDKANVYIATDAITASTLGSNRFAGIKTRLNRSIDLGDAPYAAVMVQLTVTYDPESAEMYQMTPAEQEDYLELQENWQLMQMVTANEAVG